MMQGLNKKDTERETNGDEEEAKKKLRLFLCEEVKQTDGL